MDKRKKLLMIAYYFPPVGTIAFLRNFHIAKSLAAFFDRVHVITIKNNPLPLDVEINTRFVSVHKVFNFDYRNVKFLFSKKRKSGAPKGAITYSRWQKVMIKILDSFPTNVIFGEGGIIYIVLSVLKGAFMIKRKKITHIFSSFRPMADHVIAYHLKMLFPRLHWTADFRDPPVDPNRDNVYLKKLQWWFLKKITGKADLVITVSGGVKSHFARQRIKAVTLENGIYELFDDVDKTKYLKFTLSFTGSIYPGLHDPGVLFEAVRKLKDKNMIVPEAFRMIYAGKDSALWNEWVARYGIQDFSVDMKKVSLREAVQIQYKSHVNILFSWSGKDVHGLLSGKLFEYLATRNPVFAIINGEKDPEFERFFTKLNAGWVFYPSDAEKIENILLELYFQWLKTGKIKHYYNLAALQQYTWHERAKKLLALMQGDGDTGDGA